MASSPVADLASAAAITRWTVVLPVKGGPAAKSRLAPWPVDPRDHGRLAAAIAADTLAAVTGSHRVARTVVVTADEAAHAEAERAGAVVVAESTPGDGLSAAIADALAFVARAPTGPVVGQDVGQVIEPVAVLLADLPALRPDDLDQALDIAGAALAAGAPMVAVPDADLAGTVLLAAASAGALDHAFGGDSLAAHRGRGARVLAFDLPRLRRDVDTPRDLADALTLGCGPRTAAAVADLARTGGYPGIVQATVHRFDPRTGSGSVLTDDGVVLPFAPEAFATSRMRLLRIGQRLTVTVQGNGVGAHVTSMRLETVGIVPVERAHP